MTCNIGGLFVVTKVGNPVGFHYLFISFNGRVNIFFGKTIVEDHLKKFRWPVASSAIRSCMECDNNFAEKIPVVQEQLRVVNHRISDLEQYHK